MAWTFDSIRIFVTSYDDTVKQIIARLQPLGNESIYHTFGYESPVIKIQALVIGDTDRYALQYRAGTGATYVLSGPEGEEGIFYLNSITLKRQPAVWQNLRPDLDCESPIYMVDMELYKGY